MKDRLSALLDGDLDEHAMRPVFDDLRRDPNLRLEWDAYCLIGDVLRGEHDGSPDFVGKVMAGLSAEPTVMAPRAAAESAPRSGLVHSVMPIAASVMGVAAVGLVAATLYSGDAAGPSPVVAGSVVASSQAVAADRRDVKLVADDPFREYVFAHQGVSGGGAMPGAIQYVRTVSELRQDSAR